MSRCCQTCRLEHPHPGLRIPERRAEEEPADQRQHPVADPVRRLHRLAVLGAEPVGGQEIELPVGHRAQQPGQVVERVGAVRVSGGDHVAGRGGETRVIGVPVPAHGLHDHACAERGGHLAGPVGRGVVDHDHLEFAAEGREAGVRDRGQHPRHVDPLVQRGDDDGQLARPGSFGAGAAAGGPEAAAGPGGRAGSGVVRRRGAGALDVRRHGGTSVLVLCSAGEGARARPGPAAGNADGPASSGRAVGVRRMGLPADGSGGGVVL